MKSRRARRRAKQRRLQRLINLGILAVLAIAVGTVVFYTSFPSSEYTEITEISGLIEESTSKSPDERSIRLLITMSGWRPNIIKARIGEPLNITLITLESEASHSDNIHSFVLEEMGIDVRVKAGETKTFQMTPTEPGEYTFWCVTCCGGKASPSMAGKLIVT